MSEERTAAFAGLDDDVDLLPRDPPPKFARLLAIFIIVVFAALMSFAAFVPLPESVRCRFVLAPEGGAAPVTASEPGVVDQVLVQLGDVVTAGQPLLSLAPYVEPASSPSELKARLDRLTAEKEAATSLDARLAEQHEARMAQALADVQRAAASLAAAKQRTATMMALSEQADQAAAQGAISQQDLLQRRQEREAAQLAEASAAREASSARQAVEELRAVRAVEISQRDLAMRGIDGDIAETKALMADLESVAPGGEGHEVIAVYAPHDGVVVELPAERPGIVISRGQPLLTIARPDARLRAEIQVPEKSAARVTQAQTVRLLFDAYPYTRHGIVTGLLTWVSPAARDGKLAAFARLEDPTIVVDDKRRPLRPGMGGEARIDIGERTLLEYVFEPLTQIREALSPGAAEGG